MVHQAVKIEDEKARDAFLAWLWDLEFAKLGLPIPDAVIFLDMAPDVAQRLIDARAKANGTAEDIHEKDKSYLARCYAMYRLVAERDHWIPVRCSENGEPRSIDAIHADVYEAIQQILQEQHDS